MNNPLSRRDFLKLSSITLLASLTSCRNLEKVDEILTNTPTLPPTATFPPTATKFICSPDEEFYNRFLSLNGLRYVSQVPDTLDFQKHAELSLNALTRCTNTDSQASVYFYGKADRNPPILTDATLVGKFQEAALMMREISGSRFNQEVDQIWRKNFLGWLVESNSPLAGGPDLGRMFAWMSLLYQIEGDECYRQLGEKAIGQMLSQSRKYDNYRFFPGENGLEPTDFEIVSHGWTLQGISHFFEATGYSPAAKLGKEIAIYLKDHSGMFDKNGRFLFRHPRGEGDILHFHHNCNTLLSMAELAAVTSDQELASFTRQGYEYARNLGSPLVGFFPEYIPDYPGQLPEIDCETCCVADMILLALNLTKIGQSDYWDDIDRYVRNQLVENQMSSSAWINEYVANLPASPIPVGASGVNVPERVIGSFSGWASANEYLIRMNQPLVSACCTGNGSRALYYVWKDMLNFDQGRLTINLLFNRASSWADINSFIPYEGRVDVHMKMDCELEIRLPEWVSPDETSGTVNYSPVELSYSSRYAHFDRLQRGDIATLTFPISERAVDTLIGESSYSLVIKGNDVVEINPSGIWYPFYQRSHYRQSIAPLVEFQRFVS